MSLRQIWLRVLVALFLWAVLAIVATLIGVL